MLSRDNLASMNADRRPRRLIPIQGHIDPMIGDHHPINGNSQAHPRIVPV
jgi:hypothetical protein